MREKRSSLVRIDLAAAFSRKLTKPWSFSWNFYTWTCCGSTGGSCATCWAITYSSVSSSNDDDGGFTGSLQPQLFVLISGWHLSAARQCRAANGEPCLQLLSGGWYFTTVGYCKVSAQNRYLQRLCALLACPSHGLTQISYYCWRSRSPRMSNSLFLL
jgi:hypothetical protein